MQQFNNLGEVQNEVRMLLKDSTNTHEQTVFQLAKLAENTLPYPQNTPSEFYEYYEKGYICDVSEGHAPYVPRYILPDYEKLFKKGCSHLRLDPPPNLMEGLHTLLIFYRSVPSVTHFPVYLGQVDTLLEPFIKGEPEEKEQIKWFLIHCDRTMGSSFCHMNLGPVDTKAGRWILDCATKLKNPVPNMTFFYDPYLTTDEYAKCVIGAAMESANPAIAYLPFYQKDYMNHPVGIASCYNGLPIGGGAFSLARIRLSKIGNDSEYLDGEKGTTVHYIPIEYPAIADRMIVAALAEAAQKNNYSFIEGIAQSKDSFYGQHDPDGLPNGPRLKERWEAWRHGNVVASEMKTSALFVIAQIRKVQAGAIMAYEEMNRETIQVAMDAVSILIEQEKDRV